MSKYRLNGFSSGIVLQESGTKEYVEAKRKEWAKDGKICWITIESDLNNQQFLDGE